MKNLNPAHPQKGADRLEFEKNIVRRIALGDVLEKNARRVGDKTAIIDGKVRLSHTELSQQTNQFAQYLLQRQFQTGDKIAMLAGNSNQFLIASYGILKSGLVWVPINTMLATPDIKYILEHADAKLLVIDDIIYQQPALQAY